MSSDKSERDFKKLAVIVVAIALLGGAVALFLVSTRKPDPVLGMTCVVRASDIDGKYDLSSTDSDEEKWSSIMNQQAEKVKAQAKVLSGKCYDLFKRYKGEVKAYDAKDITELSTRDIEAGSGGVIASGSEYNSYYIGWLPDGTIFDSSIDDGTATLKAPLSSSMNLIEGWQEGMIGMKIGGIREISIPSDKAYGKEGMGSIPPNTPLKFIVMTIPKVAGVPYPKETVKLCTDLFTEYYGEETAGLCQQEFGK